MRCDECMRTISLTMLKIRIDLDGDKLLIECKNCGFIEEINLHLLGKFHSILELIKGGKHE